MIHFMESISQCITAASPCKISLNVILCVCVGGGGWFVSLSECTSISSPTVPTLLQFIIFALGKSLLAWKACTGSHGRTGLALMQMTAAVSFTLGGADRRGNSTDLSGSTAELTARAAPAINISGNNNHGCLLLPKLSVSMSDLFWRGLLFWQISELTVTAPCLWAASTWTPRLPAKPRWRQQAAAAHSRSNTDVMIHVFAWLSLEHLVFFHKWGRFFDVLVYNRDG